MNLGRKLILIVCCAAFVSGGPAQAEKSVFIISQHFVPSQAQAYAIVGDQVIKQGQVDIDTYNPGYGAVGNAVWSDKELMFVTYEDSPMIVWTSTEDLQKVGEFDTGVENLSGIAVDHETEKIYVVRRDNPYVYVYSFDEGGNTLELEGQHYLNVPSGSLSAWGIAFDETNDLLYISTSTERVHVYNTGDWTHSHYIDIAVNAVLRPAVGIAVDEVHGYLYTGHWQAHNYLVRTAISPPYGSIEVEITKAGSESKPLLGVDVDDDTGLVYCTTYHHDFRVYTSSLVLKDSETNGIANAGGVAVPRGDVWYKPDWFTLSKVDDVVVCVSPPDQFAYSIAYNANGHGDTGVVITDYLPLEVTYISSLPIGAYDEATHTVTWDLRDISGSASGTLEIVVEVNYLARVGMTITNAVEMEGALWARPTCRTSTTLLPGGCIRWLWILTASCGRGVKFV
jgi:DNA-binding beta-propeller fold protein YncE